MVLSKASTTQNPGIGAMRLDTHTATLDHPPLPSERKERGRNGSSGIQAVRRTRTGTCCADMDSAEDWFARCSETCKSPSCWLNEAGLTTRPVYHSGAFSGFGRDSVVSIVCIISNLHLRNLAASEFQFIQPLSAQ